MIWTRTVGAPIWHLAKDSAAWFTFCGLRRRGEWQEVEAVGKLPKVDGDVFLTCQRREAQVAA